MTAPYLANGWVVGQTPVLSGQTGRFSVLGQSKHPHKTGGRKPQNVTLSQRGAISGQFTSGGKWVGLFGLIFARQGQMEPTGRTR